jgi:hypothetical protein
VLTTETLSHQLGGKPKPQSLRSAICRHGHYYGVRPQKMPNGLLAWPDDAVERLTSQIATIANGAK